MRTRELRFDLTKRKHISAYQDGFIRDFEHHGDRGDILLLKPRGGAKDSYYLTPKVGRFISDRDDWHLNQEHMHLFTEVIKVHFDEDLFKI